jgi:hypothetical protein
MTKGAQVGRADEAGRPFGSVCKLLAARINRSRTLFKPKHKLARRPFLRARAASLLIRYQNLQIEATPKFCISGSDSRQICGQQKQRTSGGCLQFQRECNYAKYDTQYMHRERRRCCLFVPTISARSLQVKEPL